MPPAAKASLAQGWSLNQAWRTAGVADRASRTVVARGLLGPKTFTAADLLALRAVVAAGTLTPPLPEEPADPTARTAAARMLDERDKAVVGFAHHTWRAHLDQPASTGHWQLVLTPLEAKLAKDTDTLTAVLVTYRADTRLVLPIGAWAGELASRIAP